MIDPLRTICDSQGIFLRREAIALGYGDRALARAVRSKALHRVRHGTYVLGDRWESLDEVGRHLLRARGVLRTANAELALSHTTALAMMGAPLWDIPLEDVHVTRLDGRAGRREAGVAQHSGALDHDDLIDLEGVTVTSPTRTALDLTMIADLEHSLPVLDHLLRIGAVDQAELRRRARRRDVWPSTLTTDIAIRMADGRSESVAESVSRLMLRRGGLPAPELQYEVWDGDRLVGRVDFAWPRLGVFLEFDGKVKYTKYLREGESVVDAVLREKRREEDICRVTGWRCVRIVWADLYRQHQTVQYLRSVLSGGAAY